MASKSRDISKNLDVNSNTRIRIPKPELYLVFTGDRVKKPEYVTLSDDFFDGVECAIEARVKVIYYNKENDIISQYILFAKICNEQVRLHGNTLIAVTETIRICKDREVLKEYLESREVEVVDMMTKLYDEEEVLETYIRSERLDAAVKSCIEMCQELDISFGDTIIKIMNKYDIDRYRAEDFMDEYWK